MKKLNSVPLFCKTIILALCLSLLTVFMGCSSKKNEVPVNKAEPCAVPAAKKAAAAAAKKSNDSNMVAAPAADNNEPNKAPAVKSSAAGNEEPSTVNVLAELNTAVSTDRKVELLQSLSFAAAKEDPNIIGVVVKALDDPNGEVGQAAISLLDGYEDPAIIPAVEKALKNENDEVRTAAVELLNNINDPVVQNPLALALNDPSEDVRAAALDILEMQDDVQTDILAGGIGSPYEDVKDVILSMLEDKGDQKSVDILINGLKDQNPDFRESVSDTLEFLLDEKFDSYEKAAAWWEKNKSKFDAELSPLENDSPEKQK